MSSTNKQAIVDEARSWVGTPYHSHQRLKGVGVDCAQLVAGVLENALGVTITTDMDYSPEWNIHNREEKMLALMEGVGGVRTETPEAGDVVAFRIGRAYGHMGIMTTTVTFVHAFLSPGDKSTDNGTVAEVYMTGEWARMPKLYYTYPQE